jgi:hypothetical protein
MRRRRCSSLWPSKPTPTGSILPRNGTGILSRPRQRPGHGATTPPERAIRWPRRPGNETDRPGHSPARPDWQELTAFWRARANAAGCNVIRQLFASRSSRRSNAAWRSPPLTRKRAKDWRGWPGRMGTKPPRPFPDWRVASAPRRSILAASPRAQRQKEREAPPQRKTGG